LATAKPAKSRSPTLTKKRIAANKFHPFHFDNTTPALWKAELAAFGTLISPAAAPNGVKEKVLLAWFGASIERIALLAYALYRIVPTHVARELTVGDFRSDFAFADVDPSVYPTIGLIEIEDCQPNTLFVQKGRKAPYLGSRFLGGFGQLVDWCAFGRGQADSDATISAVLGGHNQNVSYTFALVAGDQRFSVDSLSKQRMQWWDANIKLGNDTVTRTFDDIVRDGAQAVAILHKAK
jgi:hypothetical protein